MAWREAQSCVETPQTPDEMRIKWQDKIDNIRASMYSPTGDTVKNKNNKNPLVTFVKLNEPDPFEKQPIWCQICLRTFRSPSGLRSHYHSHMPKIECQICHVKVREDNFDIHIKQIHHRTGVFFCNQCPMEFFYRSDLIKHAFTKHPYQPPGFSEPKPFKCDFCGEDFKNRDDILHHILQIHSNRLECDQCDYKAKKPYYMFFHKLKHEQTEYSCFICEQSFSTWLKLERHQTTHILKKNFKCGLCKRRFVSKSCLEKHVTKAHEYLKKIDIMFCSDCGVGFENAYELNLHRSKSHEKSQLFDCRMCSQKFFFEKSLEDHINTVHGQKVKCPICDSEVRLNVLEEHISDHDKASPCDCMICR